MTRLRADQEDDGGPPDGRLRGPRGDRVPVLPPGRGLAADLPFAVGIRLAVDVFLVVDVFLAVGAGFAPDAALATFWPLVDVDVLRPLPLAAPRAAFVLVAGFAADPAALGDRPAARFLPRPIGNASASGLISEPLAVRRRARTSAAALSWAVRLATSTSARAMALSRRTPTLGPVDRFDFVGRFFAIQGLQSWARHRSAVW